MPHPRTSSGPRKRARTGSPPLPAPVLITALMLLSHAPLAYAKLLNSRSAPRWCGTCTHTRAMKLLARIGLAIAATLGCVGCGDADPASIGSAEAASTEIPKLGSIYGLVLESSVTAQQIDTGESTELHTRVTALAAVGQQGARVGMTIYPCSIQLPKNIKMKVHLSSVVFLGPFYLGPPFVGLHQPFRWPSLQSHGRLRGVLPVFLLCFFFLGLRPQIPI